MLHWMILGMCKISFNVQDLDMQPPLGTLCWMESCWYDQRMPVLPVPPVPVMCACTASQAGPVMYARLKTGEDIASWCRQVVTQYGVLLLPGSVYDHQPTTSQGYFRIGLGRQDFAECLKQLDQCCLSMYGDPEQDVAKGDLL